MPFGAFARCQVEMALADGVLDPNEVESLAQQRQSLGISESDGPVSTIAPLPSTTQTRGVTSFLRVLPGYGLDVKMNLRPQYKLG